jgi:hypothetical protein
MFEPEPQDFIFGTALAQVLAGVAEGGATYASRMRPRALDYPQLDDTT